MSLLLEVVELATFRESLQRFVGVLQALIILLNEQARPGEEEPALLIVLVVLHGFETVVPGLAKLGSEQVQFGASNIQLEVQHVILKFLLKGLIETV